MTDIFEDYFDDGEALAKVDSGTGKQLSDLVRKLRKVEDQIAELWRHCLKNTNKRYLHFGTVK